MGNQQTNLNPEKLHEKLLKETDSTRYVMDKLLKYMIKEIKEQDLLKISDPKECEKYVMFTANTLNNYFYELQIQPFKDKRGVIAFRSIKDLTTKMDAESKAKKESLCLIIAYFYIRIFQIYGALALTLIDDVNTSTRNGLVDDRFLPPGYGPRYLGGGRLGKGRLGIFLFLTSFLKDSESSYGLKTLYTDTDRKTVIFFKTNYN